MSKTDFRELSVWKKAKDLAVAIYKVTNNGELAKDYSLKDQIRRAAISIPSNIAEGNDRESEKEFIRFLYIAKGSLAELQTQLIITYEIGFLNEEYFYSLEAKCTEVSRMLDGLIGYLQKKRA